MKNIVTDGDLGKLAVKQNELFRRAKEGNFPMDQLLLDLQNLIEGKTFEENKEKIVLTHLIDLDSTPFIPENCSVEEHQKGGQITFDTSKLSLYLSEKQKTGNIRGHDLRKELKDKKVLNANVLDYLLAHPEFIPEDWKGKRIYFWGTIYRYSLGILCVRCLRWDGDRWRWGYDWLDHGWGSDDPACVSAK